MSTNLEVKPTVDDAGLVTIQLPKNRVGLWFLAIAARGEERRSAVEEKNVALERFDLYNKVEAQSEAFHAHVARMPAGRVALVSITDTAMAKTRPLPKLVYDTLRLLGGEDHIEPIGYRMPFGFVGVRGAAAGTAICALDKTARSHPAPRAGVAAMAIGKALPSTRSPWKFWFDITAAILSSTDATSAGPPRRRAICATKVILRYTTCRYGVSLGERSPIIGGAPRPGWGDGASPTIGGGREPRFS